MIRRQILVHIKTIDILLCDRFHRNSDPFREISLAVQIAHHYVDQHSPLLHSLIRQGHRNFAIFNEHLRILTDSRHGHHFDLACLSYRFNRIRHPCRNQIGPRIKGIDIGVRLQRILGGVESLGPVVFTVMFTYNLDIRMVFFACIL